MASSGRVLHRSERPPSSRNNGGSGGGGNGGGGPQEQRHSVRSNSKAPISNSRRSVTPTSRTRPQPLDTDPESERVRVAVRLRPRNSDELLDADYSDCVELQPELKRLNLRKNNWSSDSFKFDEVLSESASQKRVYEVVAKPVVESVLDGYNGTIMAYGQTGTGKTYTLGCMGKDDASERGIMVRALEDIITNTYVSDTVEISYLQIYEEKEILELRMRLDEMHELHEAAVYELQQLNMEYKNLQLEKERLSDELHTVRQNLQVEEKRRKQAENELLNIKKIVPESEDAIEEKKPYMQEISRGSSAFRNEQGLHVPSQSRDSITGGHKSTIAKICEEVGIPKILSLLTSRDTDVQIHAVKVVANLAAEDINQEKIVQEGGLDALLALLESSQNPTALRVASGAIANLAMNEMNQGLITSKGGPQLLANIASKTDDPQTLRMVAGAIANLCGNDKLHVMLKEDGAVKALLRMARTGSTDVVAQVARGLANFAKCESRRIIQGYWRGRSLLMEDGALSWLVANGNTTSTSTRRHIELAICHLAQNEDNAKDFVSSGGLKELIAISNSSARDDIRNLAKKTIRLSPSFQIVMHAE